MYLPLGNSDGRTLPLTTLSTFSHNQQTLVNSQIPVAILDKSFLVDQRCQSCLNLALHGPDQQFAMLPRSPEPA
jgi:hypothetical protein